MAENTPTKRFNLMAVRFDMEYTIIGAVASGRHCLVTFSPHG